MAIQHQIKRRLGGEVDELHGDFRRHLGLEHHDPAPALCPGAPFVDAVAGDRAASAGYYRFIDAPDDTHIDMESILAPHRERALRRLKGQKKAVLCIHDTTDLNYATLTACEGLGVIAWPPG